MLGLAGSKAYGLDTPESDEDWRGVFVYPTERILGLSKLCGPETIDDTEHEVVMHEVGKFVRLALAANPNILEQFYLSRYGVMTDEWKWLRDNREAFLSQKVRQTYGGYAIAQMKKLEMRERQGLEGFNPRVKRRYKKHAMHCFRLLRHGAQLLRDGELDIRVSDRAELFSIGGMPLAELKPRYEEAKAEMDAVSALVRDHLSDDSPLRSADSGSHKKSGYAIIPT
ncbi:MAG: nucleotidyltransferase domain-containing protein [Candidatus Paceibacterota bacterium]|jgi:hypothetical protein